MSRKNKPFSGIVGMFGCPVALDEDTKSLSRLDFAKVLVKHSSHNSIVKNETIRVDRVVHNVRSIEEMHMKMNVQL